jgi:N-terminal domain of reverse transcriptase
VGRWAFETKRTWMPEPKGTLDTSVNGPEDPPGVFDGDAWQQVDWRTHEERVRRLRRRIFKAVRDGDLAKARNLQKLTAPRGALSYPRLSREEFEGRFLGLMPYLELKGEGNRSMAGN